MHQVKNLLCLIFAFFGYRRRIRFWFPTKTAFLVLIPAFSFLHSFAFLDFLCSSFMLYFIVTFYKKVFIYIIIIIYLCFAFIFISIYFLIRPYNDNWKLGTFDLKDTFYYFRFCIIMAEELKNKGNVAYKSNNFSEAIEYYSQAIAVEPYSAILFTNRYFFCL